MQTSRTCDFYMIPQEVLEKLTNRLKRTNSTAYTGHAQDKVDDLIISRDWAQACLICLLDATVKLKCNTLD